MAPGLVSAGGHLPDPAKGDTPLDKGRAVAIMAQDKETALSIGILKESTEEIRAKGKGVVVDNMHCLGGESCQDLTGTAFSYFTLRRSLGSLRKRRLLRCSVTKGE
jgi:hypothetical protein